MAGGGELIMPEGEDEEAMRAHESLENEAMLDEWVKAKRQKNYVEADRLRDELRAKARGDIGRYRGDIGRYRGDTLAASSSPMDTSSRASPSRLSWSPGVWRYHARSRRLRVSK